MAGKLPDAEVLARHRQQENLTNTEIGNLYGTTGEAVRQRLDKAGYRFGQRRPSHARYLPWRIRADHVGDVIARRLRDYSKREQGYTLSPSEERLLDQWVEYMNGKNRLGVPLSVHYNRTDDEGFWLEPRRPGDRDFISPPGD